MALRKALTIVAAWLLATTMQKRMQQTTELSPDQPDVHKGLTGKLEDVVADKAYIARTVASIVTEAVAAAIGNAAVEAERSLEPMEQEKLAKEKEQQDEGEDKAESKDEDTGHEGESRQRRTERTSRDAKRKMLSVREEHPRKIMSMGERRPERRLQFPVSHGSWLVTRLAFARGQFLGFVYREIPAAKTLLIKCWQAYQDFGDEVIIPRWGNYAKAKVGDKITFDVESVAQDGEGKPRPVATNVVVRQRGNVVSGAIGKGPAPSDVRTQVLHYLSDENLRTDKFFQDIIAATEGGWISTDFLLSCRRLQQLGATAKSIIEGLQDAPGVEVRRLPGQEAVRRASSPPPLEPGAFARKGAANAIAKQSAQPLVPAKKVYSKDSMMTLGGSTTRRGAEDTKKLQQKRQRQIK